MPLQGFDLLGSDCRRCSISYRADNLSKAAVNCRSSSRVVRVGYLAEGRCCTRCGSTNTHEASHRTMPYRCRECRKHFSAKTGGALERSKVTYRQWAIAIYLSVTNLKGVASLKLHRDLGVTQKTASLMMHRLLRGVRVGARRSSRARSKWMRRISGGKRKNMHADHRKQFKGRGPRGQDARAGIKDRNTKRVSRPRSFSIRQRARYWISSSAAVRPAPRPTPAKPVPTRALRTARP